MKEKELEYHTKKWKEWYDKHSCIHRWKNQGQITNTMEAWLEGARYEKERLFGKNYEEKETVKLKSNIRADTPTINGRIYPKRILEKALDDYKDRLLLIHDYNDAKDGVVPYNKCIGICKDYEILDDEEISFYIKPINEDINNYKIGLFGYGNVDDNNVITDFKPICLHVSK